MIGVLSAALKLGIKNVSFARIRGAHLSAMAASEMKTGLPLKSVVKVLQSYADPTLAESWDNVGLLLEPSEEKSIKSILITNDLTEDVTDEAVKINVDMIISYHPPIFAPLKSITTKTWKERIVVRCLENKIALYSPHTSFDSIKGGVNDWLASAFELESSKPAHPSATSSENGMARICSLKNPITIEKAVDLVKKLTNLPHIRLARARNTTSNEIKTVALCAGSGASILKGIQADLFLTGEMLHHDVLDAVHNGIHVILTNHSDSERGFLSHFGNILDKNLNGKVDIILSKCDKDPLTTV